MNIKQVSERTGLTNKAIKYYEDEGLNEVYKNPENNYRKYTDENVLKLNLIASLRLLNLSISDIKIFLSGEKNISTLLTEQIHKINKELDKLNQKRTLTQTLINNLENIDDFSVIVKKLDTTLDFTEIEKQIYLSEQLKRVFPGIFGQFFATVFEPFFGMKINNEIEREKWLELVNILDDMNEIPNTHPIMHLIQSNLIDQLENYRIQNRDFIDKILQKDEDILKNLKDQIINLVNTIQKDAVFKENFIKQAQYASDIPSLKESSPFSNLLYSLSPKYKKFIDYQLEIKKIG